MQTDEYGRDELFSVSYSVGSMYLITGRHATIFGCPAGAAYPQRLFFPYVFMQAISSADRKINSAYWLSNSPTHCIC